MQYTGKIVYIGPIEYVGRDYTLEKRTVVLEEDGIKEYKTWLAFELFKDKVKLIDRYQVGEIVTVDLSTRANYSEQTQRYYNTISAYKISSNKPTPPTNDQLF